VVSDPASYGGITGSVIIGGGFGIGVIGRTGPSNHGTCSTILSKTIFQLHFTVAIGDKLISDQFILTFQTSRNAKLFLLNASCILAGI
jgi:hypothetical protein